MRSALKMLRGVAVLAAVSVAIAATPAMRHTKLVKSAPAADESVATSPKQLELWFSEAIEMPVSSVKLTTGETVVETGKLTRDDKVKDAPVVATIAKPLAPGKYTVAWVAGSKDGHPAKGTYDFTVKGK
jgi:methionine-rich copper-binding protein CopC